MRPPSRAPGSETVGEPHDLAALKTKELTYTTGEMARLSNSTLRTVRFYEEAGILTPIGRTEGGHRVFKKAELERLMLVSDMREAGFSLEQIREVLDAKRTAQTGGDAVKAATRLLSSCVASLREKMEILNRLSKDLEQTVEAAERCADCGSPQMFPSECGSCERLQNVDVPRGMRVLWDISPGPNGNAARRG
jgi:DNA-binding transcriptional MerR regulator